MTSATAATAELEGPLGAVQMGLIYVNPEGTERKTRSARPRPAIYPRDLSRGMAMNDEEETVALIAGGHTFGKTHGAGDANAGRPGAGRRQHRAAGAWLGQLLRQGPGRLTRSAAASRSTWTTTPTKWSNNFFDNLFGFEWELTKSPAGAHQWTPKNGGRRGFGAGRLRQVEASLPLNADHRSFRCDWTRPTQRSRSASMSIRISSPTRSPAPGTS